MHLMKVCHIWQNSGWSLSIAQCLKSKNRTQSLGGRLFLQLTLKDGRTSNQLPLTDVATFKHSTGEKAQHFVNRARL